MFVRRRESRRENRSPVGYNWWGMKGLSLKHFLVSMIPMAAGFALLGWIFRIPHDGPFPSAVLVFVAYCCLFGPLIGLGMGNLFKRPGLGELIGFLVVASTTPIFMNAAHE